MPPYVTATAVTASGARYGHGGPAGTWCSEIFKPLPQALLRKPGRAAAAAGSPEGHWPCTRNPIPKQIQNVNLIPKEKKRIGVVKML